ncbi:phage/plasmid replication protein, II/X family [Gilvimarinus sp. SDUM040013]|uniref:phage/plasmid replication protein, II/X family n=1 Tax=Gilvimarinus gilvus TaxID=3058038 RepID=UPI0026733DC3|nr:phage/plasmid replication protein, II/X family [Gilvimarinus sp. SDUM040013]MDO3385649.1 phage/plasmid replication protein, II/X family [Gilvimarinus sp. SDUM040013]
MSAFDIKKEYLHAGMIDWLTLRLDLSHLPEPIARKLQAANSKIFKVNAVTGDIDWETYAWESVKSDTHQICFRVGGGLQIQGSPARLGLPNNAFGSLDIQYCATKMIDFAKLHFDLESLPPLKLWTCSRIDVTRNYLMQSGSEAKQALAYLKQAPEGRQKHSFESQGLYIGKGSSLHKGKIYLKGQDAKRCKKSGRAEYTEDQIKKSERLLRAEYTLNRHILNRFKKSGILWHQLNPQILLEMHENYFKEYFSVIEVTDMGDILEKLLKTAPTEGRAKSAYDCYVRIRMIGYEQAKESYSKTCWYRHLSFLKNAGLTRSDLQAINVIPLRKRSIEVSYPVRYWDDISAA